ncbi:spermidine synthase [Streptomyces sp. 7-21]|uniref:spermidine synthase n=1 Tax=Streptomyces sp. 7-21 TaxID=2802283 RepID=UPI00191FF57D|nr:fused MFS/spermidine synthase [Streptomyces sp. 7-21]MBL1067185.1 fused MFS/spermidine synthase [Streptomyces sp. 7-21]
MTPSPARSWPAPVPVSAPVDHGTARLLPDLDHEAAWLLTVDDAPQSYVNLADPRHLEFEYTRWIGHALDTAAPPGEPLDLLHLGAGALTLARYAAATRPGSRQRAVEADRALARLVGRHLPPPDGGITLQTADARDVLAAGEAASTDVVIADVFGGSRVPAHLTTTDAARDAARVLRPGGLYAANLADTAPFAFLRSQVATAATAFAELCLLAEPATLRGRRFGNAVLLASDTPLPVAELARRAAADPFPARVVHGAALERFADGAAPVDAAAAVPSPRPPAGAPGAG